MNEDAMLQADTPQTPQPSLGFGDVYNIYKDAQKTEPVFKDMSMPEFARTMAQHTGDSSYLAGAEDSRIKRANAAINRFIEPVASRTGQAGEFVGGLIGPKAAQYGQQIGHALPRGFIDTGLAMTGGALMMAPEPTMATKVAGGGLLALAGASSGADVYEKTDSPVRAGIGALGTMLIPGAAKLGTVAAEKALLASPLYKVADIGARIPVSPTSKVAGIAERFGEYLGANTGMAALQEGQIQADSLVSEGRTRPFDEQHMVELLGAQLPFGVIDAPRIIFGPKGIARSGTSMRSAEEVIQRLQEQKTLNVDRKALPPPRMVEDIVWENGKQVKKQRFSNTVFGENSSDPEILKQQELKARADARANKPYLATDHEVDAQGGLRMSPDLLNTVVEASDWIRSTGQQTVTPGKIARQFKLKTPEQVASVMQVLQRRGVLSDIKSNGSHRILQATPEPRDVLLEQIKTYFPHVWENLQRQPTTTPTTPQPGDLVKPPVATPETKKPDVAKPAEKPAAPGAVDIKKFVADINASDPNLSMGEAWARLIKQDKSAEYMTFQRAWLKAGNKFKPVQEPLKGVASPEEVNKTPNTAPKNKSEGLNFDFSQTIDRPVVVNTDKGFQLEGDGVEGDRFLLNGTVLDLNNADAVTRFVNEHAKTGTPISEDLTSKAFDDPNVKRTAALMGYAGVLEGNKIKVLDEAKLRPEKMGDSSAPESGKTTEQTGKKPFRYDINRGEGSPQDQLRRQISEVAQDVPDVQNLLLHPNEMLLFKQGLTKRMQTFLQEVYRGSGIDPGRAPVDMQMLDRIKSYDIEAHADELHSVGFKPEQVVQIITSKIQLDLAKLALEKLKLEEELRSAREGTGIKEHEQVVDRIKRMDEIFDKMDPKFREQDAAYQKELKDRADMRAKYDRMAARNYSPTQILEQGVRKPEGEVTKPENPFDIIARMRNYMDAYEMRGPRRGQEKPSDTESFGPADYVYSEAVRFYEDKATHIADWVKKNGGDDGMPSHELELAALQDFLKIEPAKRAARIADKVKKRQAALDNGERYDEAADDIQRAEKKQAREEHFATQPKEETDLYAMDDPTASAAEIKNRETILRSIPVNIPDFAVSKLRKMLGKTSNAGYAVWQKHFNVAMQAFRDGVFELRPENRLSMVKEGTAKKEYLRVRPESGISYKELPAVFGLTEKAMTKWLNTDFLPALQLIRNEAEKSVAAGKPPGEMWEPPSFNFSETGSKPVEEGVGQPSESVEIPRTPDPIYEALDHTTRFFQNYFLRFGYTTEKAGQLTTIARKLVAYFHDKNLAHVAELVNSKSTHPAADVLKGVAFREKKVVGISNSQFSRSASYNTYHAFSTLAHEFFHVNESTKEGLELLKAAKDMDPDERMMVYNQLIGMMIPKELREDPMISSQMNFRGTVNRDSVSEFCADITGLMLTGITSPSTKADLTHFLENGEFLPGYMQDFMGGMYADVASMSQGLAAYFDGIGMNGSQFSKIVDNVKQFVKTADKAEQYTKQWMELRQNIANGPIFTLGDPDRLVIHSKSYTLSGQSPLSGSETDVKFSMVGDKVRSILGMNGTKEAEKHFGVQPSFFERVFMPMRQLAEKYPQLRPIADLGYEYLAMARQAQSKILEPFLTEGVLGKSKIDYSGTGVTRVLRNKGALDAFNKIALIKNERGQADANFRVFTDAEMKAFMPGIDPKLQDSVIAMHRALEQSAPKAAKVMIEGRYNQFALFAAMSLLDAKPEVGWQRAMQDGQMIMNTLRTGIPINPDIPRLYGSGYDSAIQLLRGPTGKEGLVAKVQQLEQQLAGRPWWTPEVRLGKYMVAWKDGAAGFDTEAAAIAYANKKNAEGVKTRTWKKSTKNDETSGMHPILLSHFKEIEQAGYEAAMTAYSRGNQSLYNSLMQAFKPGEQTWKEYMGKGFTAHELPRKLKDGREELDIFRGFIHYVAGVTNGVARTHVKHTLALMEADPVMKANPELQKLGRDYIQTMIYPPTHEMSKLKNLNFLWFMGGNLSSMLLEGSQSLFTVAPHFIQATNDMALSYKTLLTAGKDIARSWVDKNAFSAEEKIALKRGSEEGVVDFGVLSDFYEAEDLSVVNLKKLTGGDDNLLTKSADVVKRAGFLYGHFARQMYSQVSRVNNQIAFLMAFRLARDGKIPGVEPTLEGAYRYAKSATPTATYTGGQAARPVGLFANSGKFFGAVGAMYSLQSYSYAALSNIGRLMSQALDKERLTVEERSAAKKALGHMLTTQFLLGGAMGMPFVGAMTALAEQALGVSVKPTLEKGADTMAAMLTDDEDAQDLISDTAMRGVAGRFIGADVSNRVSLGNVLGVDAYNGFSLESLVGPVGSVMKGFLRGGQELSQGHFADAAKAVLPRAYSNAIDLARYGNEVRDNQGRLVMTATPAEQARMLLGFKPYRLSQFQTMNSMVRQSETVAAKEHGNWLEDTARVLIDGKPEQVRAMVMERAKQYGMNPRALAQRVVETAQELTIPYNPIDSGSMRNSQERQQIAESFKNAIPPRVQETKKLQQRASLERVVGIPQGGRITPGEMRRAQMIDRLLQLHPTVSRDQAAMVVEGMLSRRSQRF